jgi:hypothetical protein
MNEINDEMKNRKHNRSSLNDMQFTASTLTGCKENNKEAVKDIPLSLANKYIKR